MEPQIPERSHPFMLFKAVEHKPTEPAVIWISRWRHAEVIGFEFVIRPSSVHSPPAQSPSEKYPGLGNPCTLCG